MQAKPEYFIGRTVEKTAVLKKKGGKKDGFVIFFVGDGEFYVHADLQYVAASTLVGKTLVSVEVKADDQAAVIEMHFQRLASGPPVVVTCPYGRLTICDKRYTNNKHVPAYQEEEVVTPTEPEGRAAESPEWKPMNVPPKKLWDDDNAA